MKVFLEIEICLRNIGETRKRRHCVDDLQALRALHMID